MQDSLHSAGPEGACTRRDQPKPAKKAAQAMSQAQGNGDPGRAGHGTPEGTLGDQAEAEPANTAGQGTEDGAHAHLDFQAEHQAQGSSEQHPPPRQERCPFFVWNIGGTSVRTARR